MNIKRALNKFNVQESRRYSWEGNVICKICGTYAARGKKGLLSRLLSTLLLGVKAGDAGFEPPLVVSLSNQRPLVPEKHKKLLNYNRLDNGLIIFYPLHQ